MHRDDNTAAADPDRIETLSNYHRADRKLASRSCVRTITTIRRSVVSIPIRHFRDDPASKSASQTQKIRHE
jgi:hypothetical protein